VAKVDVGAEQEGKLMIDGGCSGANLAEGTGEAGGPAYADCDSEAGLEGGVEEMSDEKEASVAMQRGWWAARARISRAWLGTKASESNMMAELEAQGVEGFAASEGKGIDTQELRCLLTGKVLQGPRWAPRGLPPDPGEGRLFGDPEPKARRRRAGKSKMAEP
ncbi:unnamed protein product, partial [Prorocentrum cordatum]